MEDWHFGPTFSRMTEFEQAIALRLRQIDREIEQARSALMGADEIGVLLKTRASIAALAEN